MNAVEQVWRFLGNRLFLSDPRVQRAHHSELMQAVRMLTLDDAQALTERLWHASLEEGKRAAIVGWLNAVHPGATDVVNMMLIDQAIFYPPWLYLGASQESSERILTALAEPTLETPINHLLQCAAWIGDSYVQDRFRVWRESPPEWRDQLYVPPEDYALEAGWELAESGRRDLIRSTSYMLMPGDEVELTPTRMPVAVNTPYADHCPWCGRQLVTLLDIDLRDARCATLLTTGERLCIPYCTWCSLYTTIYMNTDLHGNAQWSTVNGDPPEILAKISDDGYQPKWSQQRLVLGEQRLSPYEAVDWMNSWIPLSQFGGHPAWINDASYPRCPGCGAHMSCIGQVAWEEVQNMYTEGITYAYVCIPCGFAATTYDQS